MQSKFSGVKITFANTYSTHKWPLLPQTLIYNDDDDDEDDDIKSRRPLLVNIIKQLSAV